jgi:LysM repeat protein
MKILKIFGIVVGIHVFALILIFANPGCSSTTKPPPEPADTVTPAPSPSITMPNLTPPPAEDAAAPASAPAPTGFNPDAPAVAAGTGGAGAVHFTPTRPNSPAASALTVAPVADVTPAATYSVKSGDSLWSIAKRNHLAVGDLAAANSLRTNAVLHEGQKLIIPSKAAAAPTKGARSGNASTLAAAPASSNLAATKSTESAAPAPKASGQELTHTVKEGETLGMIARKYGVKAGDIAVRNNITNPQKVRAGTELIIPGWKATGKGSGTSSASAGKAAPAAPTESTPSTAPAEAEPSQPAPSVPVIHLDDSTSPLTPAPKS